jgi:phosphoserine phosphatase RsbU/P
MLATFRSLLPLFKARLSQPIVLWVFYSLVAIELIILVPSYQIRKHQLLSQLEQVGLAKISQILRLMTPKITQDQLLDISKNITYDSPVVGVAIYQSNGHLIQTFGESFGLSRSFINSGNVVRVLSQDGSRYDVTWPPQKMSGKYTASVRLDASSVEQEMNLYTANTFGLILLISVFVTLVTMLALGSTVITPILGLRNDLLAVGENQLNPEFYCSSVKRKDELGDVMAAFNTMYHQIKDREAELAKLFQDLAVARDQLEKANFALCHEMETGRQIQQDFLPQKLLQPPGWEIAAFFSPARQVSGDFYDVFPLPDDCVGLVIGDVCDKGVGAALFMALFRSLIRVFSDLTPFDGLGILADDQEVSSSIDQLMASKLAHINILKAVVFTNNYIVQNHSQMNMFATLFFGVLDPTTGLLTYINGGHEPLAILGLSGVRERLAPTGPAVGLLSGTDFKINQVHIKLGEILIAYTDGVTDARDPNGKFFTEKQLLSLLQQPFSSASALLNHIATRVGIHIAENDQFDDITMLSVRRIPLIIKE